MPADMSDNLKHFPDDSDSKMDEFSVFGTGENVAHFFDVRPLVVFNHLFVDSISIRNQQGDHLQKGIEKFRAKR